MHPLQLRGGPKILEKPLLGGKGGVGSEIFILVGGGGLKRFAPFSYLNHLFILSLNVKVCIRFITFLQISLCFFICQELSWMRGLCISLTYSCFLFPVGGECKKFEDWGS